MANKLMYIANDDTQNYPFCRFKLVFETFEHSTYEPTNQIPQRCESYDLENVIICKTLKTSVIIIQLSILFGYFN